MNKQKKKYIIVSIVIVRKRKGGALMEEYSSFDSFSIFFIFLTRIFKNVKLRNMMHTNHHLKVFNLILGPYVWS
jgi:hypothetical protein